MHDNEYTPKSIRWGDHGGGNIFLIPQHDGDGDGDDDGDDDDDDGDGDDRDDYDDE